MGRVQLSYFEEHLFEKYLEMCKDQVPQVRLEFARSVLYTKPFLEPNKDKSIFLSEQIDKLKNDKDRDVVDVTENVDYQLLLSRKKVLKELSAKEVLC